MQVSLLLLRACHMPLNFRGRIVAQILPAQEEGIPSLRLGHLLAM